MSDTQPYADPPAPAPGQVPPEPGPWPPEPGGGWGQGGAVGMLPDQAPPVGGPVPWPGGDGSWGPAAPAFDPGFDPGEPGGYRPEGYEPQAYDLPYVPVPAGSGAPFDPTAPGLADPFGAEPLAADPFARASFPTDSFPADTFPADPFAPDAFPAGPLAPDPFAPDPFAAAGGAPADPFTFVPPPPADGDPGPATDPGALPGPRPGGRAAARRGRGKGGPAAAPTGPADEGAGGRIGRQGGRAAGRGRRAGAATTGAGAPAGGGKPDGWRRLVPQALVVAVLAGGTSAFVAADKTVTLTVDGVPRSLHTFADDVGELLDDEDLGVGGHDLVAPGTETEIDDGDEIVVRYGRPVTLTLDGESRRVWTTARDVDGALRQLGVRAEGAYLSASRSAAIPRSGLALQVRTERGITFMADGRERTIRTNAATVREALEEAGITLGAEDTTSVDPGSFPRDGQTVTVLRVSGSREVAEEVIPFETERIKDSSVFTGTEVVEQPGRTGLRRVTYSLRTVNGVKDKPRKTAEEIVREPVTRRIRVGTKPMPNSVAGADHLNWSALAHCESGGRPGALDPSGTYGGLYQFDDGTWRGLGGAGRPHQASSGEQTYRAKKLFTQRGASPWPHCGRRLYR
ncbi:ubiquitin-like domain-containing protein [Streptomyces sp. BI20]|uniref:ubiquitin-like domain-containing protein n=1 Tax=Streptomyces sp. BI20 TaxID=3403460 RepID=UPI003C73241D